MTEVMERYLQMFSFDPHELFAAIFTFLQTNLPGREEKDSIVTFKSCFGLSTRGWNLEGGGHVQSTRIASG